MAKRDELGGARRRGHGTYARPMSRQAEARRVYLAGPPYADEYRRRAGTLVRELGWEPVDPMRRDYRGRTRGNETEIVESDLAEIEACDAVLAAFTSPDEGTAMEAWYAHALGKPIVAYAGGAPPQPWTVYVADAVCDALEGAVQAVCAAHHE